MNFLSLRKYPVTITVSLIVMMIHAVPSLAQSLQLDFNAVADGEWWRIWTGHLTHFGVQHLGWDLLMFIGLAGACEHRFPRGVFPALALMAGGISLTVRLFCPEVSTYRGLSGIDTGLFVWFAGTQWWQSVTDRDTFGSLVWSLPCVGLVGKLFYEAVTGQTLFVDSDHFIPLVESHLAGVFIGALICLYGRSVSITSVRYRLPSR